METPVVATGKLTCQKCLRTLKDTQFYTYKDKRKFELCKECATMHIDNFNPETFTWLLQKLDFPYIPSEWNTLRDKAYAKDPMKMNGMSVFGKYTSKMRMVQWNKYHWADSQAIQQKMRAEQEQARRKAEQRGAMIEQNFKDGLITQAQYKTLISMEKQKQEQPVISAIDPIKGPGGTNMYSQDNFIKEEDLPDPAAGLTQDDKIYLAMKWGRLYTPAQWISLEQKYTQMTNSFDIQDSDTIGTLIILCKTYLKMNEAIDMGDMDGFAKLSRAYDSLRKSAKFTAAQNKQTKNDYVDSIGELVAMCEKQGGFIPRYLTDIPQDKVDKTLQDMNNYVYQLVTKDLGLGQRIEDQLKKMRLQQEMNDDVIIAENADDLAQDILEDEDHQDYYNMLWEDKQHDKQVTGE